MDRGYAQKPSNGWYEGIDPETREVLTGKVREKDTVTEEFWNPIFEKTKFKEAITQKFKI